MAMRVNRVFHPNQAIAHQAVAKAVRDVTIRVRERCEECHRRKLTDAHHPRGYERPHELDVEWLCRSCHKRRHLSQQPRARVTIWMDRALSQRIRLIAADIDTTRSALICHLIEKALDADLHFREVGEINGN